MIKLKVSSNGKLAMKGGKPSCECCSEIQLEIRYDWEGTDMKDLDTSTQAFNENVGYACAGGAGRYVKWLPGKTGRTDDTSLNGFERVNVLVSSAKKAGLWTSSVNVKCFAGWFTPSGGSGDAKIEVTYRSKTKFMRIVPGSQTACADTQVATITVYSKLQPDQSYFELS